MTNRDYLRLISTPVLDDLGGDDDLYDDLVDDLYDDLVYRYEREDPEALWAFLFLPDPF